MMVAKILPLCIAGLLLAIVGGEIAQAIKKDSKPSMTGIAIEKQSNNQTVSSQVAAKSELVKPSQLKQAESHSNKGKKKLGDKRVSASMGDDSLDLATAAGEHKKYMLVKKKPKHKKIKMEVYKPKMKYKKIKMKVPVKKMKKKKVKGYLVKKEHHHHHGYGM